ncbi:diaminopimelate decarboxylase [Edaphobacillus lindanitolerans]|uniref:Diaminopimelate decarboxylase n=1 Tax=Edaphobacillus lindanitolerans TaxID=550447 RepID=A0A1U7PIS4_9BACI|nr:diaminopimelate decarboxylase [Edaphobacillus lindanitolerans]SIT66751.1 diaminopimelate decarboxylase [Edaphobacillus lindanitolerans]
MHLYGTQTINSKGHLEIGGTDTVRLADEHGTPLIVYDTGLIRSRARAFKKAFSDEGVPAQVAYASKAFSCLAIYRLAEEEGLALDVVSGGELFTAIRAGFPAERIHFHGNNKSREELRMAFEQGVGCIVADNFMEIGMIGELSKETGRGMDVLIRVTPGIEAHTHDYITTGQEDSKFGFDLNNGQADEALRILSETPGMHVLGLHCHIGSQIFDTEAFGLAARSLIGKMDAWRREKGFVCPVLNLGGGFGIRYTEDDHPLEPDEYVRSMILTVKAAAAETGYPLPEIWIEPGRSLVGDAGTTLYTAGSMKTVPGIRTYLAVDGGMSDNIRPALYGAEYTAALANRMKLPHDTRYTIAGKCCESGDKLIENARLPETSEGDLVAVFCTGAYGYAMASNYNRLPRPAVVFAENGEHRLAIRRETYEDLIRLDAEPAAVGKEGMR